MPSSGSDAVDNCQTQLPSAAERDFFFFFSCGLLSYIQGKKPGDLRGFHLRELLVLSREQVTSPPAPPAALLFMLAFPLLWVCLHDTLPTKHVSMMHGGRMT